MTFSTMMDRPLLISDLFEHGRRLYRDSRIITVEERGRSHRDLRGGGGPHRPAREGACSV